MKKKDGTVEEMNDEDADREIIVHVPNVVYIYIYDRVASLMAFQVLNLTRSHQLWFPW